MLKLLALLPLLAAQMLDGDMSRQEQKETGIYKLTDKQKIALQQWIDTHYAQREASTKSAVQTPQASLQDNINNGRYLRLSDSSTWEINPDDTPITQSWITPADIFIAPSNDTNYPYQLTNSLTGSKVKAKKIPSIPRPSPK